MAAGTMALSAGAYAENATIHPDANIFGFNGYQKPPTVGETDREPHTGWFRFGTNGEEIEIGKTRASATTARTSMWSISETAYFAAT